MGVSASSRIFITLQLSVDALDVSVALISYIPVSLIVCEMRTLAIPEGGNASCVTYSPVSSQLLD